MGLCLRSLEQSLTGGRKQAPAEGMSSLGTLHEQIAVVRGERVSQPTDSLRALENRVLGRPASRSAMNSASSLPRRETLRLDQGQVAPSAYMPAPTPYVPDAYPVDVTPSSYHQSSPVAAQSYYAQQYAAQSPQQDYTAPAESYATQHYSPEFSAPNTGRFQVESFAQDGFNFGDNDDDLGSQISMPPVNMAPLEMPSFSPNQAPATLAPSRNSSGGSSNNSAPTFDDSDWISAAQSERPATITAASKQGLNSSLASAKDDFERELASILGTGDITPAAQQEPDALFNPNNSQPPASTPTAPAKPAEPEVIHPNHNVFDQMGLAMRYANSFDLGNVSLKDRFDHFEQDLNIHQNKPRAAAQSAAVMPQSMSSPFVDPMNLDEFDLVAELAEIGVDQPAVTGQAPQAQTPQAEAPQAQPTLEAQPPAADSTLPVKPLAPELDNPLKPMNRTETTAGDDHE